MFRGVIGLVQGEADGEISRNRGVTNIEGERIEDFGDGSLVTGSASGTAKKYRDVPIVGDEYITSEREAHYPEVYVEFLADLSGGWVTIDSSDGEFLWKFLGAQHGVGIERAEIDLDALIEDIREWERASVWQSQTSWGDTENPTEDSGVTIAYHDDATWPTDGRAGQLGFRGFWDSNSIRGTVTRSGYVALFDASEETAGTFVGNILLPHCSVPDDEQAELGGGGR